MKRKSLGRTMFGAAVVVAATPWMMHASSVTDAGFSSLTSSGIDQSAEALLQAQRSPTTVPVPATRPSPTPGTTTTTTTTTTTLPSTGVDYLIVGDSLCELSNDDLLDEARAAGVLGDLDVDCEGGRAPLEGLPIALEHDPEPDVLLFELGTNPGDTTQSIDTYERVIAGLPRTDIYFTTGYREHPEGIQRGVDILNAAVVVLAGEHERVRVCDWAQEIRSNTQWFVDDIHYDQVGRAAFGAFMISCMLGEFDG